jgi:molybdenum cofactor guanylyltransferase
MSAPNAYDIAEVTAAILAGGEGARVGGQDKGLLPLAGERLIARASRAMRAQAGTLLICANRHEETYAAFGAVVADALAGYRGPLAGVAGALAVCTTSWLLTAPVDCPNPPVELGSRLLAAAIAAGTSLAVAHDGEREQPLFAIYRRELAESCSDALVHDLPVWRWQRDAGAAVADFSDRAARFVNLNTPEEFRTWEQRQHG